MTFEVLKEFETETPKGTFMLKEGQKVRLSKDEAIPLIQDGLIQPIEEDMGLRSWLLESENVSKVSNENTAYCCWLKSVIDDCQMPCFEIDATTVYHECPHFRGYWNKRLTGELIK